MHMEWNNERQTLQLATGEHQIKYQKKDTKLVPDINQYQPVSSIELILY